jgi:sporulation protein YlmC with PRC-barrel domain
MAKKLLMIPGYIVGIGSLCIISFQTLRAVFSESKSVTVYINRFGEQYADLVFLLVLWGICLLGLVYLYHTIREGQIIQESRNIEGKKVMSTDGVYLGILRNSLIDKQTGMVQGVIEPSQHIDHDAHQVDEHGNLIVSFDSIKIIT